MKNSLQKIEDAYLYVFKIVIVVLLSIALLVSIFLAFTGVLQLTTSPNAAPASAARPNNEIDTDRFINQFEPKPAEIPPQKNNSNSSSNSNSNLNQRPRQQENAVDSLDVMVDKYLGRIWVYYDSYQKTCGISSLVDKDTFVKSFPKLVMKSDFSNYGIAFADSQDKFLKAVLESKKTIQYCKSVQGRGGVFASALNWHKNEFYKIKQEEAAFESREKVRMREFERDEQERVAREKVQALTTLTAAGIAFVIFMSLSMLLIFAKIENNLRNVDFYRKNES